MANESLPKNDNVVSVARVMCAVSLMIIFGVTVLTAYLYGSTFVQIIMLGILAVLGIVFSMTIILAVCIFGKKYKITKNSHGKSVMTILVIVSIIQLPFFSQAVTYPSSIDTEVILMPESSVPINLLTSYIVDRSTMPLVYTNVVTLDRGGLEPAPMAFGCAVVLTVVVVVIGGTTIYVVWKICKKLDKITQPNTNTPPEKVSSMGFDTNSLSLITLSYTTNDLMNLPPQNMMIQSSTNLSDWSDYCKLTTFITNGVASVKISSPDSKPLWTNNITGSTSYDVDNVRCITFNNENISPAFKEKAPKMFFRSITMSY